MNFLVYATFPLFLLALLATQIVQASGVILGSQAGNGAVPSAATLAGCPKSCGDIAFDYPFGIGNGCFRGPDFDLTCVGDDSTMAPSPFLHNGTIQVISDIVTVNSNSNFNGTGNKIKVNFSHTIPMRSGVDSYDMNWTTPGESFILSGDTTLNITGCDFDAFLVDHDGNRDNCTSTCPKEDSVDTKDIQNCNGIGCCSFTLTGNGVSSFTLRFVRHSKGNLKSHHNQSSIRNTINVTTDRAELTWRIADQPWCGVAREKENYACISGNSVCNDDNTNGYSCWCRDGYRGNPYISDGCSRDKGYNPIQHNANCTRQCGNIPVLFPFGLEEGCFGRKQFYLNCTNTTSSVLLVDNTYQVTNIYIDEGLIKYKDPDQTMATNLYPSEGQFLYFYDANSSVTMQWAVANLTCQEAKHNISGYACVSTNSECIAVTSRFGPVGYRCKCSHGFQGNPYIQDGCEDIDECLQTNSCIGICKNNIGSYNCAPCPHKTEYDSVKKKCTSRQHQNMLSGIIIGLSSGFSALLLSVTGIHLIRRWKRDIKKRLRRKYFRKNQGLLLEQLILSDENASEKTKIFCLEELEKATNNFDSTRILGHGGHGMVYKGILSDQRVVAIKKSKIIEEGQINQFINEVTILSQINHRNIVKLFGCCLETEVPLLVYDFIPNGSLYGILHADSSNGIFLSWDDSLRIAAEAAGALYYLHSAASVSVFHRDVKSSNILLDSNYTAKVSDFGASRLVPIDQTHVVTNVQGTFGYLDPEYYHTGQLNEKSDVYSFGVVLLELLVRKKPIFISESGVKQSLTNYFLWEIKVRQITEIVAPHVLEEASEEEVNCVCSLAEMCLRLQGDQRPTMKQVETALQFLRTKRVESSHVAVGKDEETQTLLTTAIDGYQLSAIDSGRKSKIASQHSQSCYSFEEEFMSSAGLPR